MQVEEPKKAKKDIIIWLIVIFLSIISLLEVYSTIGRMAYSERGGDTTGVLLKHTAIILLGLTTIFFVQRFPYKRLAWISKVGFWIAIPLLFATIIVGLSSGKDAGRWLSIPIIGQFQTSEIVKIILIIYLARILTLAKDRIQETRTFWSAIVPVGLICLLIVRENFSTAALLFFACFLMMFVAGVNRKYMLRMVLLGALGLGVLFFIIPNFPNLLPRGNTWINRIEDFRAEDRDEVSQVNWAKMSVATGGVFGKTIGKTEFARFFDASHNDFIYAIIIEEGGLFLGVVVLSMYLIFFFRCRRIAFRRMKDGNLSFGSLIVVGLSSLILVQALVNMAVAVNLAPVTGQTLPFVSYGGTSFLSCSIAVGIILSLSVESETNVDLEAAFFHRKEKN